MRKIYRPVTGTTVPYRDALDAWEPVAHDKLVETAHTYRAWISTADLAEEVQEQTGIRTTMLLQNWVGPLLRRVASRAGRDGEPMITALCVDTAQRVGPGYAAAVQDREGALPIDAEQHAAEQRLLCYRKWATDLPADDGSAVLTPRVEAHRERKSRPAARADDTPELCPSCFTVLPRNGTCNYCA